MFGFIINKSSIVCRVRTKNHCEKKLKITCRIKIYDKKFRMNISLCIIMVVNIWKKGTIPRQNISFARGYVSSSPPSPGGGLLGLVGGKSPAQALSLADL
jgi:hypothetical protein